VIGLFEQVIGHEHGVVKLGWKSVFWNQSELNVKDLEVGLFRQYVVDWFKDIYEKKAD